MYIRVITVKQNTKVLTKKGYKITDKEFYNLSKKEGKVDLSREEEVQLVIVILERNRFYLYVQDEYILEDRRYTKYIIREIFFISVD